MEKIKEENFEEGFEKPNGLEMFNLSCVANIEEFGMSVKFGFAQDEILLDLMKSFGKEKEYQNYLKSVSRITEPVLDKLNKVTIDFIKNELLKSTISNHEELDRLVANLLAKVILGGIR